VPVWLQASTAAIHGDAGERLVDEDTPPADGPPQMAGVARAWEEAAAGAPAERQVVLRTSVVLDRDTPALDRLAGLVRWGLGGRVGSGRQWVSWMHVDDWLAVVRWSLGLRDDVPTTAPPPRGVLLATAPHPVRNAELMATLRRVLRRPPAPPTPVPFVRLGALLLRTDPALALTGRRAVSARLAEAGFQFAHPSLDEALTDLLGRR
jgi:NAD dependent epimerase/dehydratase family enzyme